MTDIMTRHPQKGWKQYRLGQLFDERKHKVSDKDFAPLSVTMNGIVPQLDSAAKSDDGDNRKLVRVGDYVINSRSDRKGSGGISNFEGSVSLISIVLKPKGIHLPFAHHLLRSPAFQEEFYRWGHGIVADLWTTRYSEMKNIRLFVPDLETQKAIAGFLDRETARIDQLIDKKQRLAALSSERFLTFVKLRVGGGLGLSGDCPPPEPNGWRFLALRREITLQRGVDITKDEQNESGLYPVVSSGGVSSFHDRFLCKGPGVIIGRKGSAGKLHYEERDYWPHDTVLYIKRFAKNNRKFVYYKFMSLNIEAFDRSSANPTINRNLVHPEKVWWPVKEIQERVVVELDAEHHRKYELEQRISASVERLREFRAALITSAVTGQIDVANWGKRGQVDQQLDNIQDAMQA